MASRWPADNEAALIAFYGNPAGNQVGAQLVYVAPPFRMTYEGKPVPHLLFHKKAADALLAALTTVWNYYGRDQAKIDSLGISKTAGTYNPRKIAGSNRWSNHAFGAAIDINADDNGFYKGKGNIPTPMVAAFKAQGARWGGDYHGRTDPMHFEFCASGEPEQSFEAWLAHYGIGAAPTTSPQPAQPASRFTGITATVFGGRADRNTSAYDGHVISDTELGVALPFHFQGARPKVTVVGEATGKSAVCDIVDVGPWNTNDPYWTHNARPQAESGTDSRGRHTNLAGIDLTPATAAAIGVNGKGKVTWFFTSQQEKPAMDTPADLVKKLQDALSSQASIPAVPTGTAPATGAAQPLDLGPEILIKGLPILIQILATFIPQIKPFVPLIQGAANLATEMQASPHDPHAIAEVIIKHLQQASANVQSLKASLQPAASPTAGA